jgi:hypothetical protein
MPKPRFSLEPRPEQKLNLRAAAWGLAAAGAAMALVFALTSGRPGRGLLPGYEWRNLITVDSQLVAGGSDLLDFPLMVKVTNSDLRSVAYGGKVRHPEGFDVRFTRGDGATPLFHKLERYDAQAGEYVAWVSLDTLRGQRSTRMYMYYGNARIRAAAAPPSSAHRLARPQADESARSPLPAAGWADTERKNLADPARHLLLGKTEHIAEPLPVEFQFLSASLKGGALVVVEWATQREVDNQRFIVERSSQGKQFEALGELGGGQRSYDLLRYNFPDPKPFEGTTFYRIKQIDNDGDFSYSDIVEVAFNPSLKGLQIGAALADAAQKQLRVELSSDRAESVRLELFDAGGTTILREEFPIEPGGLVRYLPQWGSLPPGLYVVGVMGQNRRMQTLTIEKP